MSNFTPGDPVGKGEAVCACERCRSINAELLEALKQYETECRSRFSVQCNKCVGCKTRIAIAKAEDRRST